MHVVDGQDEPVLKLLQAIQSTVLADEVIALKDLHRVLGDRRGAPKRIS